MSDGPIQLRSDLAMVQLTSRGVDMDVLLIHNEAEGAGPGVDRARVQRRVLVGPLLRASNEEIREMAPGSVDRARERGVVEVLTGFVRGQHSTANQAVRLFKVRGPCVRARGLCGRNMCARGFRLL